MYVLRARNVHCALPMGLDLLDECGIPRRSRAGNCVTAPAPVTTVYEQPTERVLFWPERDANPFFHFFEALYFLAGRNDAGYLDRFVRDYSARFSDDGRTLHGSYGHRWRRHWRMAGEGRPLDQVATVIQLLRQHPDTRRAVLAMWDPISDLHGDEGLVDIPCNTAVMFRVRFGRRDEPNRLDMTVTCRSNDIIFGAYGANAVHFSFLQEYVAANLGLVVGSYWQVSNDFHAYEDVLSRVAVGSLARPERRIPSLYETGEVRPFPLIQDPVAWDNDLGLFMEEPESGALQEIFFNAVAQPLWMAHVSYREKRWADAAEWADACAATDWRAAALQWLNKRVPVRGRVG
jgi:thymidylate synthase